MEFFEMIDILHSIFIFNNYFSRKIIAQILNYIFKNEIYWWLQKKFNII